MAVMAWSVLNDYWLFFPPSLHESPAVRRLLRPSRPDEVLDLKFEIR